MSVRQRRQLYLMAVRLEDGDAVSDEDRSYLVQVLRLIADGDDANDVLGLARGRGEKASNEKHRLNLARLFHWIIAAKQDYPDGYGLSTEAALEAAASLSQGNSWTDPKSKKVLEAGDFLVFRRITYEALRKAWYNQDYADLKKLKLNEGDFDFPYGKGP